MRFLYNTFRGFLLLLGTFCIGICVALVIIQFLSLPMWDVIAIVVFIAAALIGSTLE